MAAARIGAAAAVVAGLLIAGCTTPTFHDQIADNSPTGNSNGRSPNETVEPASSESEAAKGPVRAKVMELRDCFGAFASIVGQGETFPFGAPQSWPGRADPVRGNVIIEAYTCHEVLVGVTGVFKNVTLGIISHGNVSWPEQTNINSNGLLAPLATYSDEPGLGEQLAEWLGIPSAEAQFSVDFSELGRVAWESDWGNAAIEFVSVPDGGGTLVPKVYHRALAGAQPTWVTSSLTASTTASYVPTVATFEGSGAVEPIVRWGGSTQLIFSGYAADQLSTTWERT